MSDHLLQFGRLLRWIYEDQQQTWWWWLIIWQGSVVNIINTFNAEYHWLQALSEFVDASETREGSVPRNILMAIMQLTEFLSKVAAVPSSLSLTFPNRSQRLEAPAGMSLTQPSKSARSWTRGWRSRRSRESSAAGRSTTRGLQAGSTRRGQQLKLRRQGDLLHHCASPRWLVQMLARFLNPIAFGHSWQLGDLTNKLFRQNSTSQGSIKNTNIEWSACRVSSRSLALQVQFAAGWSRPTTRFTHSTL